MKLNINSITIPPALMALADTTPAEKLLLAIHAADPYIAPWRVHRSLSVTRVGLTKLTGRLRDKGLLMGHKVSVLEASENEYKVPHPAVSTLVVHGELLDIRFLLASEKVLLAFYVAHPDATNGQVATTLGISPSGLKKLKRGLLDKHVLAPTAAGYTVRLPGYVLIRDKAGSRFIPETEAVASGHVMTSPPPRLVPAMDIHRTWSEHFEYLISRNSPPSAVLRYTEKIIKRIETESPEGPERDRVLETLRDMANANFAIGFVAENAPKKNERHLIDQITHATTEQWAAFREKAEGMQLAGIAPQKLLGFFGTGQQADAAADGHAANGRAAELR